MTKELTDEQIECIAAKYSLPYSLHSFARELIEHDRAARGVPDGWVLVPITDLEELRSSINGNCYKGDFWEIKAINTMLAAAQQPAAQPERKPMTRDQVDDLTDDGVFLRSVYEIVQAVESAHGIKDTP